MNYITQEFDINKADNEHAVVTRSGEAVYRLVYVPIAEKNQQVVAFVECGGNVECRIYDANGKQHGPKAGPDLLLRVDVPDTKPIKEGWVFTYEGVAWTNDGKPTTYATAQANKHADMGVAYLLSGKATPYGFPNVHYWSAVDVRTVESKIDESKTVVQQMQELPTCWIVWPDSNTRDLVISYQVDDDNPLAICTSDNTLDIQDLIDGNVRYAASAACSYADAIPITTN